NEQLIGYDIQVRGPFDACDRCKSYLAPTSLNSRLSILPSARLTETLSTAKTSLINPNSPDGCWDELYMIAGGTGITPMLQLIKYHLERSMKRENDTNKYRRMHLLFGNRKIEDVIDGILLEDLALSSQGQLTVTFCLSEPPSDWEGLKGRINKRIIQDWMNMMMQGVSLQSPNETQTDILHSHSIRRDPNENCWSYSSSYHQLPFMKSHEISQMSPLRQYNSVSVHTLSREFRALFVPPDNRIYEDRINDMGPYLEPKASSNKSILSIDPDLANSKNGDNLIHGKIIVSGPYGMLVAVEQDLLEMGFNDDVIILY
ncbi:14931_t:CDS:2, partial [Racocetra persica]